MTLLEGFFLPSSFFLLLLELLKTSFALSLLLSEDLFTTTDHVLLVVDLFLGCLNNGSRDVVALFGFLDLLLDSGETSLLSLETVLFETSLSGLFTSGGFLIGLCTLGSGFSLLSFESLFDAGVDCGRSSRGNSTKHAHALLHTSLSFRSNPSCTLRGRHVLGWTGAGSRSGRSGRRGRLGSLNWRWGWRSLRRGGRGGSTTVAFTIIVPASVAVAVIIAVARSVVDPALVTVSIEGTAKIFSVAESRA